MSERKVFIIFIVATVLILSGGIYFLAKTTGTASLDVSKNAQVKVSEKQYDWGTIKYDGGNATKTFSIKNTGTDILQLSNIKTSCTCTKAEIEINGKSSPSFSMHSVSGWIGEVKSGEEARLTVIFDPTFHGPSGVGPVNRIVSVETNDASVPKLEFTLTGNVVK